MKNFVFVISSNAQFMNIMKQQNLNSIGKNKFEISLNFLISNFMKKISIKNALKIDFNPFA